MHLSAAAPRVACLLYHTIWRHLRPRGYLGRLYSAVRARAEADWRNPEQVWAHQREKINSLLDHAVRHVPYYRRLAEAGETPRAIDRPEEMTSVPILTKEIIRREGEALIAENVPSKHMRPNATGGSTGEPVHFWCDSDEFFAKNAAEHWSMTLAGLGMKSSAARLWGAGNFEPTSRENLREGFRRLITNTQFINCFRMGREDLLRAHRRLTRFQPEAFIGYVSALVEFSSFLEREGLRPDYPRTAVISAAETLHAEARETLERVFRVPVYDRYGSREVGLIAMECDRHEGLHIDCENVFVELADEEGLDLQRIIVTKLDRYSMPLIRYDIEDLAEGPSGFCPCGRGFPTIKRVVGRVTETIRIPEGGCLPGELFPHLFKDCGIRAFQVEQAADYSVDVALVKTPDQTPEQHGCLRRVITDHLGPSVSMTVRYVDDIKRSRTGKLLPVISHAPADPAHKEVRRV